MQQPAQAALGDVEADMFRGHRFKGVGFVNDDMIKHRQEHPIKLVGRLVDPVADGQFSEQQMMVCHQQVGRPHGAAGLLVKTG